MTAAVIDYVRACVIDGTMKPGEWYSGYRLAEQLGVSRSPVRDGLLRLEQAGLIRFSHNRGFQVVPTSPEDVAEIFCVRAALEVPATGRAARATEHGIGRRLTELRTAMDQAEAAGDDVDFFEHDQALHAAILTTGGMNRGREIVENLRVSTRLLGASTSVGLRTLGDISREHDPIIRAVLAGDPDTARAAMEDHLAATGRLLVRQAMQRSGRSDDPDRLWSDLTTEFYRRG